MSEYTTKELEEKFGIKIRFFDPEEEPLLQTSYYDWETGSIVLNKYLSGKVRLVTIAHEIGHKLHFGELRQKEIPIYTDSRKRLEYECEAWKRGLSVAKELDIMEAYKKTWRGAWFPEPVIHECPFPGDDKVPYVSIGKGQEYSFKEWKRLMNEYIKTGKWLGTKHLGVTEHII